MHVGHLRNVICTKKEKKITGMNWNVNVKKLNCEIWDKNCWLTLAHQRLDSTASITHTVLTSTSKRDDIQIPNSRKKN